MLRCRGCGELVSEWAARCPSCGRSTSDAEELDPEPEDPRTDDRSETGIVGEDPPAATPEREAQPDVAVTTARRWYRGRRGVVAVVATAAAVVFGGIVAASEATSGSGNPPGGTPIPGTLQHLDGEVLAMAGTGSMELSRPDGQRLLSLPRLGTYQNPNVSVAPDGRLFTVDTEGRLLAVFSDQPVTATVKVSLSPPVSDVAPDPFTDRDQALLVVVPNETGVRVLILRTGRILPLGVPIAEPGRQTVRSDQADAIAGDPQSIGAFVSVIAPLQPSGSPPGGNAGLVDTRVDLYRYGQPTVLVTTAAQLNVEAGNEPSDPTHLVVYPSPSGDELAVVLDPDSGGDSNTAMVVIDRQGHLLGKVDAAEGPIAYSPPAWSPDGRSLAYTTFGPQGTALATWSPGRSPTVRVTPLPGSDFSGCLWSPQGSDVLCTTANGTNFAWVIGDSGSGPLYTETASAMPIAWVLPAPHS